MVLYVHACMYACVYVCLLRVYVYVSVSLSLSLSRTLSLSLSLSLSRARVLFVLWWHSQSSAFAPNFEFAIFKCLVVLANAHAHDHPQVRNYVLRVTKSFV